MGTAKAADTRKSAGVMSRQGARSLNAAGYAREARRHGVAPTAAHPTNVVSAMRLPVGAQQQRQLGLAQALRRLEREHVALLLAMCELEAEQAPQTAQGATPSQAARDSLRAALAPMLREDLRRAQYALARAAQGQYGVCEHCGRPIALRRLQVQISVTSCESCATRVR